MPFQDPSEGRRMYMESRRDLQKINLRPESLRRLQRRANALVSSRATPPDLKCNMFFLNPVLYRCFLQAMRIRASKEGAGVIQRQDLFAPHDSTALSVSAARDETSL
jgi:hypothetical protein